MREFFFDLPADHICDDLIHGHVFKLPGTDILTIPHDRDTVGDML